MLVDHFANDVSGKDLSEGKCKFEIVNFQLLTHTTVADVAGRQHVARQPHHPTADGNHGDQQSSDDDRSNRGGGRKGRQGGGAEELICFVQNLTPK